MLLKERLKKIDKTLIMGIINVTPDSFSDGGHFLTPKKALDHAYQLIDDGADILDIGGESSRPGATPVPLADEVDRILPVIKLLKKHTTIHLSVDTYKSEVMQIVLDEGVEMINDIKALTSNNSLSVVSNFSNALVTLMHMKGTPADMQNNPTYNNPIELVIKKFLQERINSCKEGGISKDRIIIDPGFGFGKTMEHNWQLFKNINTFTDIGCPVLIGISRKRMLKDLVGDNLTDLDKSSAFFANILAQRGSGIIRTHNVSLTKKFLETSL